jgi:hypothetical protein
MAGKNVQPTALILGAGFSRWAAKLPVAEGLFDFRIMPLNASEKRKLLRLKSEKERWDNGNPGGLAEQFIAAIMTGLTDRL